jgi:hypothetical protein
MIPARVMESIRATMSVREAPFRNGDVEAVAISVLAENGLSRSIAVVLAMRLIKVWRADGTIDRIETGLYRWAVNTVH